MQNHGKKKAAVDNDENLEYVKELLKERNNISNLKEIAIIIPDDYLAWDTLKSLFMKDKNLLKEHGDINLKALMTNPKSYSAWNYRLMLANNGLDLNEEDKLTRKLINYDKRNFHCWNYRRKLNLSVIYDYFNYSCLHDLISKNESIDSVDIIYTNPYYEGSLYLFHRINYNYYLKKYQNITYLHFKSPFKGELLVNNKVINIPHPVLLIQLHEKEIEEIIIDDIIHKECEDDYNYSFIDELLELEPDCVNLLLMKLKITENYDLRNKLINKLINVDPMRKMWYSSLISAYYKIIPLIKI